MKPQSTLKLRASALAVAAGFALSALPFMAEAAGLGKVTVFSALGQPLRAEVELSATRDELSSMKASLASPEAFKAAGLDYASTLRSLRFAVDRNASGQPVIRLSSERPINDPFVDMLLELNWASGRLVREYTFLLDPPDMVLRAPSPVTTPAAAPAMAPVPAMNADDGGRPAAAVTAPAVEAAAEGSTYEVRRGDTLRKIATANLPDGVSLDQMLVGLYRANQEAFDGANMNRLRSGKILTIPARSDVEAVPEAEAHKVVAVQAADWNAYRRKLAAVAAQAPAADDAGTQTVGGKITPKVEEKAAPMAAAKDQVRVSKTEVGQAKAGATASEEELIAKNKALQEANERLAMLEKNVAELQKLLEMKNQSLAELQKQSAAPTSAPAATMPEPVKPAAPAVVAEPPKAEEKAVEAPVKPAEPPKMEEPKPAEPAPAVEPPKAEAKPPAPPKPKPKVVPPPPPPEPTLVEELLDNPMLLAGGGGILALLLAFVAIKRRRAAATDEEPPLDVSTADLSSGGFSENSVFRNTGGQSVDTSQTPPQTDFSQAGPGTIDTDEVDPVAEADVYMAYGRDAQAEEILLEAKAKDPKRFGVHLKLLEIYANRQANTQFEALATELYGATGGTGVDWDKAAAMGRKLDPENPMYGGERKVAAEPAASFDSEATMVVSADSLKTSVMPASPAAMAGAAAAVTMAAATEAAPAAEEPVSLDFDLGPGTAAPSPAPAEEKTFDMETTLTQPGALHTPPEADGGSGLDFDLGNASTTSTPAAAPAEEPAGLDFNLPEINVEEASAAEPVSLDFDIGLDAPAADEAPATPSPAPAAPAATSAPDDGLEFDVNLTESTVLDESMAAPAFDMTTINLDLAEPKADGLTETDFSSGQMATMVNPDLVASLTGQEEPPASAADEVATKLDLAKAYEEMGDLEGARELLQEVMQEGSAAQQEAARAMLDKIAS